MPGEMIRLLALDGGGVRGLSSLMILHALMAAVDSKSPPKPCEYFDMIGGTDIGGLIAIMLGRLRMTVDECIEALLNKVFENKSHGVKFDGKRQDRLSSVKLGNIMKQILRDRGLDEDELLMDTNNSCKVFVCATRKLTSGTVCLTSYRSPDSNDSDLVNSIKIWEACCATSATTTFFDPIAIGPSAEELCDGTLFANNPIYDLWNQAKDVWGDQLQSKLRCVVSIGTGIPSLRPMRDDALGIETALRDIAIETEETAERFRRDKWNLVNEGRYYRFSVNRGLGEIGLEESNKKREIVALTRYYISTHTVFRQIQACASNLPETPYRIVFSLQQVPLSNHFVDRPSDTAELDQYLLPQHSSSQHGQRCKIFVLYGLGGVGKTQLAADFARRHQATFSSVFWLDGSSEVRLRQSLADCARRIPHGQIPDWSRSNTTNNEHHLDTVVADVLGWLARPDNVNWLLIFDNVDRHEDVRRYILADHGSVLITTRRSGLAQLVDAKYLMKVDKDISKAIFEQWYGEELVLDESGKELLELLDGLPLALAQAASYCRKTGLDVSSYVQFYKQHWDDLMSSEVGFNFPPEDFGQKNVKTTWTVSFRAIEIERKTAANLLRVWAFLANKDLWHGLLQAAAVGQEQLPKWFLEIAHNEAKFRDTVRLLLSHSMIEVQHGSCRLHPVVHEWLSHIQDGHERREFLRLAITIVRSSALMSTSKGDSVLQRRLLPHAESCSWWMAHIDGLGLDLNDMALIDSVNNIGNLYSNQGRLTKAEAMYERALQGYEKALGLDHTSTLETVNKLGALYRAQGRLPEAEAMEQRALQGYEKAHGPDHTSTLATIHNPESLYTSRAEDSDSDSTASESTDFRSIQKGSIGPSSLTSLTSTDREQVTQSGQSFTVPRYQDSVSELEAHEKDDDQKEFDLQSVVSAPDTIGSLAESQPGTATHWQAAVDSFVSTFGSNLELLALFQEANTNMQRAKFVRNHQRLLKHFFLNLRSESTTHSQQLAVELLRSRRRRASISYGIWNLVQPSDNTVLEKIKLLDERNRDRKILLERFLQERDSASTDMVDTTFPSESSIPLPVPDHADSSSESSESSAGDDDEGNDEAENRKDQALSKLQATAEFLTSGLPFILYKEDLRKFLYPTPRAVDLQEERKPVESVETDDATATTKEADNQREESPVERVHSAVEATNFFPHTLSALINSIFSMLPFPISEPPVPPGKTRIRWKCSCGDALFDDFVEIQPGALQALQSRLQELHETESADRGDPNSVRDNVKAIRDRLRVSIIWMYQQALNKMGKPVSQGNNALPLHRRNSDPQVNLAHNQEILYILMCIDKGEFWTHLHQQRLPSLDKDCDLFQFLREQYQEHRSFASWFNLRGVNRLSLARFMVDNNSFASVHNHERGCEPACVCIPPTEMIDSNEYQCRPAPKVQPSVLPAISSKQLTHYFLKPHAFKEPQRIIFNQLPKRACGQLALSPNDAQLGWGVHFQEGWNWTAIYGVSVVVFIIGALVFGVVWATTKHDIQSAFAITASWMALGPILLGYIAARNAS